MAFDFPNSPSTGQRVTGTDGKVYVWDGVKWASVIGSFTVQSMGDVGRNLLHNPLFNVGQRGAGPWATYGNYTADRWALLVQNDTVSVVTFAFNDGARAQIGDEAAQIGLSNSFTGNVAAGAYTVIIQMVENVRRLAGKTITVSFWAASGAPVKLGVSVRQNFGTGGSPSASVDVTGQSFNITTTYARYSSTFVIPSIAGKTLGTAGNDYTGLLFWYSSGSTSNTTAGGIGVQSGAINLWGVQLEIGSVATPLEKPDPRYDLANCQRFFWSSGSVLQFSTYGNVAGAAYAPTLSFPNMRATPTAVASSITLGNATAAPISVSSINSLFVTITQSAAGFSWATMAITLSADL